MEIQVTAINDNVIEDTMIDIQNTFEPDPKTGYRLKDLPFETIDLNGDPITVKTIKGDLLGNLFQYFKI